MMKNCICYVTNVVMKARWIFKYMLESLPNYDNWKTKSPYEEDCEVNHDRHMLSRRYERELEKADYLYDKMREREMFGD